MLHESLRLYPTTPHGMRREVPEVGAISEGYRPSFTARQYDNENRNGPPIEVISHLDEGPHQLWSDRCLRVPKGFASEPKKCAIVHGIMEEIPSACEDRKL